MKLILTGIVWCLMAAAAAAQPGFIKGEVVDTRTEERIEKASISIPSKNIYILAKADGSFAVENLTGEILVVSAVGYKADSIQLKEGMKFITVRLQPGDKALDEVVVSATLKAVSKLSSPIPVETYSAKFFKKNVTASVFEALSIVNGVQPQLNCNVCNTGDIHINGMEGPYTMVLIDGMPIVSNLATVYGFSGIPSSLIKRVEIVKGPASTLYGSEAVAGLINIITKDPASAKKFTADVHVGSYQDINADLSAKISKGKLNGIVGINGYYFNRKFDINNDNFTDVTLQKRISIFSKWDYARKNHLPFSVALRWLKEDRWGGECQWNKQYRGSDQVYGENIITDRIELLGNYGINAGNEKLLMEYSYNYHRQDSYYGTVPYMASQHTAFVQLRWDKTIGKHNLLAGIPYRYTWYDDNTTATLKPSDKSNLPSIAKIGGLFVQDEIKFSRQFSVLNGLRYEYNNLQGSVVSPRLAVKWQPSDKHTLRLSGGTGFRIVNLFTEDHAALSGAREVVIEGTLKPEKSWNVNLNYMTSVVTGKGYFNMDASLFYTYFTNKIIPDYDTDPQKIIYSNIDGYAVSRGLALNTDMAFTNGLKITAGITLMDVYNNEKNTNGIKEKRRQVFAPVFSGMYAVSYTIPEWKLTVDFTGKVFGPQRLPIVPNDFRPEYSPWFSLANLQFTKRINTQWELYAGIKNLFNFIPSNPILRPFDPFDRNVNDPVNNPNGYTFDPSYNYAPVQGIRGLAGFRYSL